MKKGIALFLASLMGLSLIGCSGKMDEAMDKLSAAEASEYEAADYEEVPEAPEDDFTYPEEPAADSPYEDAASEPYYEQIESKRDVKIDSEEEYDHSDESPFKDVKTSPLSTFASDVDTASYSNMRRFIEQGMKPEGVRIEELVNYFDYTYPAPPKGSEDPFAITTEIGQCPWNTNNRLAMVAVQGDRLQQGADVANNIVFLLDVSGSMDEPNKLPLLQESFKLLVSKLDENDVVSVVTYAGSDEILADSVRGNDQAHINHILENLWAGGSTAGADGIRTAYDLAEKNWIPNGNNRIILATDGDFNVGESSEEALEDLITEKREKGIFISVLGFGMGNLKDNRMETIADHGNGNYAYIDTIQEAKKVLVDEFDSTMYTIAKDVKFQIEFNPAVVKSYRLIGYNNRRMENKDFNDDKKDAGDIGAGHNVTAFYELVLADGVKDASVDDLKYQNTSTVGSDDFFTVKIRYKKPDGDASKLVEKVVSKDAYTDQPSQDFGFASAVAEFGLILTDSEYKANSSLSSVEKRANANLGKDTYGIRKEFVQLVQKYRKIMD